MSREYDDDDGFMGGGGAPSFKFNSLGDTVTGLVLGPPVKRVQTDFTTGEVKAYKDGNPRYQYVVEIQTELRDPNNPQDDGVRSLFLKWHSLNAVRQAITAVGAKGLRRGGVLTLQFTSTEPPPGGKGNPVKLYAASYIPPEDDFMSAPSSPAPAQPYQPTRVPDPPRAALPPAPPPVAPTREQQQGVIERLRAQVASRAAQPAGPDPSLQAEEPPF
jgi:hypothetical protein